MGDDQEMVDVEVVDVEVEKSKANEDSLLKGENLENVVDSIVVINAETKEGKVKDEDDPVSTVKESDGTSAEGEDDDSEKKSIHCEAPTFVTVLRDDYDEEDESEDGAVICIQALNSDNLVQTTEEGEKRKRKRVPRKIEKVEVIPNDKTSTDNKPYKCDMCHWQFKQRYRFKRHMRTHTGERPYQCPQCEKQFSRSHILKVHMMIHSGEKPFICEECGWSFMKKYHLQRHMRTHTGEMPFVCEECGVHFSRQYYLKKHLVSAHGAVIKPEKKKSKKGTQEGVTMKNSSDNCVLVTLQLDPSEVSGCEKIDLGPVDYPDIGNKGSTEENDEGEETDHVEKEDVNIPLQEPKIITIISSNGQGGYTTNSEVKNCTSNKPDIKNGTQNINGNRRVAIMNFSEKEDLVTYTEDSKYSNKYDMSNGRGVNQLNSSDGSSSLPDLNNTTIISSSNKNTGEASLKECIDMVNQLVERKPMETIIIKRDVHENEPVDMKNDTESKMDVDLHSISVK